MKWKFSKKTKNEQIDEVGNILQKGGAIKPKACQKCKKEFDAKIEETSIVQNIPGFECILCDIKYSNGNEALGHMLEKGNDHTFKKIKLKRKVGSKKILVGRQSNITFVKNDVIILCGECLG